MHDESPEFLPDFIHGHSFIAFRNTRDHNALRIKNVCAAKAYLLTMHLDDIGRGNPASRFDRPSPKIFQASFSPLFSRCGKQHIIQRVANEPGALGAQQLGTVGKIRIETNINTKRKTGP